MFVLLVGERFGGEYRDQNKSITWREWDEAMSAGLTPIVLVDAAANTLAQQCARARQQLAAAKSALTIREQDAELMRDPAFANRKPSRDRFPGVQRFIDALRKGHVDNWAHLDWDGSPERAMQIIDQRLGALFVSYQLAHASDREHLRRWTRSARAVSDIASRIFALTEPVRADAIAPHDALQGVLERCATLRGDLFGYRDEDRFSFGLHVVEGDELAPGPRIADRRIRLRNRRWKANQSHVSMAVARNEMLVSGDIRQTEAWVRDPIADDEDQLNYVSVVSLPIYFGETDTSPDAAFVVTSSRVDHFRDLEQPEVLTVEALARMFSVFYRLRGPS